MTYLEVPVYMPRRAMAGGMSSKLDRGWAGIVVVRLSQSITCISSLRVSGRAAANRLLLAHVLQ